MENHFDELATVIVFWEWARLRGTERDKDRAQRWLSRIAKLLRDEGWNVKDLDIQKIQAPL